jgi:dTDP-4-dehydrorhamnose reductase
MMKKILVTGAKGQLGSALKKLSPAYDCFDYSFIDLEDLDLSKHGEVRHYFSNNLPHFLVNCAAFTAVDQAENSPDMAYQLNAYIPALLGKICLEKSIRLIHFSTDYVYKGKASSPHCEDEKPYPVSVYAKSKLQGEKALWSNPNALIIRTSWLYSEFGRNFLKTMIKIGREKSDLGVVFDQVGTPTYAGDLAGAVLQIIRHSEKHKFKPGIYNYSNEGVCSWYDFAWEIMKLSGTGCRVFPIRTSEYPLPAKRPEYSVLDKRKIKAEFGIEIPHWKESLQMALKNLKKNEQI